MPASDFVVAAIVEPWIHLAEGSADSHTMEWYMFNYLVIRAEGVHISICQLDIYPDQFGKHVEIRICGRCDC